MIYDIGDKVTLTTTVTDDTGALTNATMAIAVTKPDGTAAAPAAPTNTSTGIYKSSVVVDQAGTWTYTWTASGAVIAVQPGQFTVTAPTRVLVASFEEFKKHLNRTDLTDDAELRTHLESATDWVVETIRGPLTVTTFTDLVEMHRGRIFARNRPLVSVTSVTSEFSGATLDPTTYVVDTTRCMVRMMWWSGYGTGWYTLVYKAGLAFIPEKVKLAGLIVAAHLWQTQNGGGGLPFPGDNDFVPSGLGFAVPRRAMELLERSTIPRVN